MTVRLAVLLVALAASSCRILPEPTPDPTYHVAAESIAAPVPAGVAAGTSLRLARVEAAPAVGERFTLTSGTTMRFDEFRRWHEPPEVTLERRLAAHLFERLGFARASSGPTLTVELLRHEVDLDADVARVRAHVTLTADDRRVLAERTLDVTEPVPDTTGDAIADATGRALDGLVARIVALVTAST